MFTILSYDIVSDKRRTKVMKFLKGYGTHVQYSVFECHLTRQQLEQVQRRLRSLIDLQTDSVRIYLLDKEAIQRIQIVGIGQVSRDQAYYLIGSTGLADGS